ncbi:hypothetical protein MIND_00587700 [Mycena indigotica]|uniref:DUF6534 domain-containing protein n=1 Tax=Mycena indigotica TaxID=2126181 RepID=A0A8H6W2V5_9AGAR|nr:uncharacterized protein MIND_00587700 [Mycena indigotica]KAF7303584.1 hypothetical protein MIND_00587700 [Mycena indigotica]
MAGVNVANAYLLLGSWLSSLLFSLEVVLIVQYLFFSDKVRPRWHKLGMSLLLAIDTIGTSSIFAQVYVIVIPSPCGFIPSSPPPRSMMTTYTNSVVVNIVATFTIASMEQSFLCYVYYNLTRRRFITGFLALCILVHAGFSYASAGLLVGQRSAPTGGPIIWTTKVGAISCAVTDILISATLVHTFIRLEQTSAMRNSTHSLLRRLMLLISTSGILVASITLVAMFLVLKSNPAYPLFFFCQSRLYVLTILANFLVGNASVRAQQETSSLDLTAGSRSLATRPAVTHVLFQTPTISTLHGRHHAAEENGPDVDMHVLSFTQSKDPPQER